ncbi:SMI1/KNR4 family protein [Streptomyces sp. NPDC002520]
MLPPTLREAYALFGRRPDLTSHHDVLLDTSQLHLDDRRDALVFRHENQGAASWGILVSDLGHADPTVFMRPDLADKTAERWEVWLGCLSLAFIEIILSECLHGPKGLCDFLPELDDNQLTLLEPHYMPVPFPTYPPPRDGAPGTRWFTGPDVLLREDDRAVLSVQGRTSGALDQVHDIVQGDWIN